MDKIIPYNTIIQSIILLRKHKVILDNELAVLYGVPVKRLKEQVKRNIKRFPEDFMFELSQDEYHYLRINYFGDVRKHGKHTKYLPYAFTEQGVAMLSSVLNNKKAVQVNIEIMRAFVRMRQVLSSHKEILEKLKQLEKKDHLQDKQIKIIFDAIREMMKPIENKEKKRIGFVR